jgi:hypothetical protein
MLEKVHAEEATRINNEVEERCLVVFGEKNDQRVQPLNLLISVVPTSQ